MAEQQETHVLIIGAGISGLIIAHGLHKAGIKHTIFETEEAQRWRPKEWTMGIHWGLPLLEDLLPSHLAARIPTDGSVDGFLDYNQPPNNGAYIFDGLTGEVLKDLTVTGRIVRVSRRKLRTLCSEGVPVKHSYTLQTVNCDEDNGTVTATFTNGQSYTGTLLIGCDGPRSVVRSFLFEPDPKRAQAKTLDEAVNITLAYSYDAQNAKYVRSKTHPVWCMGISPQVFPFLSMQDVPDPDKPETWRFFLMTSWLGTKDDTLDNAGRIKLIKEKGEKLAEPFRTVLTAIPDDSTTSYTDLAVWVAEPWDTRNGLVTLAGDSAHPMPPFRGQGGNHAIQDSHNFVEAVKQIAKTTEGRAALQAKLMKDHSDEVARRGAEETILSTKNGKFLMSYYDFKESPYNKQGLSRGGPS